MIKIRKVKKTEPVYDITVKKLKNFFANNILVHNCSEICSLMKTMSHLYVIFLL
jgi:hypothetical protein